jgi:two-component system, chemotaxis family, CheB/CheR fusion protein
LNNRNIELGRLNNDLANLIDSAQMAIIIVGPDQRIRRFTPEAGSLLGLVPADVGRPLADVKLHLAGVPDLEAVLTDVFKTARAQAWDIKDLRGRHHSLRLRPYRTLDNQIDGVVVMLIDVDALKRQQELAQSIVATVREPLLVLDGALGVLAANQAAGRLFGGTPDELAGQPLYDLGDGRWNQPELRRLLAQVLPTEREFSDFELEVQIDEAGPRIMLLNARLMPFGDRGPAILLAIEDISARKAAQDALADHHRQLQTQVDELSRFNRAAVERELRMIELKKTINALCRESGQAPRFPLEFEPHAEKTDGDS